MYARFKKKLHEIQTGDEETKQKWLVVSSAITIVLVVTLWIGYIQIIVLPSKQSTQVSEEVGLWTIMKTGGEIAGKKAYQELWAQIRSLQEK